MFKIKTYDIFDENSNFKILLTKLKGELDWKPTLQFEEGIEKTVTWYLNNMEWMENINSGDYKDYYKKKYDY